MSVFRAYSFEYLYREILKSENVNLSSNDTKNLIWWPGCGRFPLKLSKAVGKATPKVVCENVL